MARPKEPSSYKGAFRFVFPCGSLGLHCLAKWFSNQGEFQMETGIYKGPKMQAGTTQDTPLYNDVVEEILLSGNITAKPNTGGQLRCRSIHFVLLGTQECLRHFVLICRNTNSLTLQYQDTTAILRVKLHPRISLHSQFTPQCINLPIYEINIYSMGN